MDKIGSLCVYWQEKNRKLLWYQHGSFESRDKNYKISSG